MGLIMYQGTLARFPWNLLMVVLCYTYAKQLGREANMWAIAAWILPFLTPLVLAFLSPNYGSPAYEQRMRNRKTGGVTAVAGPFEKRFPLLDTYLQGLPADARSEPRALLQPVSANFEFSAWVPPANLDRFVADATARQLTVWTKPEADSVRVFGAGLVDAVSVTEWLRQAAPERKLATAVHQSEAPTKFFEYYPKVD